MQYATENPQRTLAEKWLLFRKKKIVRLVNYIKHMGGNTPQAGPDYNGFMTKSFGRQLTQTYIYFAVMPTVVMG